VAGLAFAQAADPNPTRSSPDVFLDNHRPLMKKKEKAPTSRTVTGKVVDETGQPIEGALVTVTNTKTNEKTNFFTKKDGRYNFEDLSFTIDYNLQASYKNLKSEPRKLSQYDRTANVVRILEINPDNAPEATAQAKKDSTQPKN
jgi:hypothetical protein